MKGIFISLLFVGILRGMESLINFDRENRSSKIISIMDYRNRRMMKQLCQNG
ncbi:MAG: hypothetical protein IJJ13_05670 [Lachnospiraceae bacterium]|nr:hypothetical protein [Lachnospiraceae bacterium]